MFVLSKVTHLAAVLAFFALGILPVASDSGSCGDSSSWQPTTDAFLSSGADDYFRSWWSGAANTADNTTRLDNKFGNLFGSNNFQCGIESSACISPSCFTFQGAGQPSWIYLTAVSLQNLNQMFQSMYDGVELGQSDITNLVGDLADNFFKWRDPSYPGNEITFWMTALVSALTGAVSPAARPIVRIAALAIGSFAGAGAQQVSTSLGPGGESVRDVGMRDLNVAIANYSMATRKTIVDWADKTFRGQPDENGKTIVDYVQGGSFVESSSIPNATEVEQYMKTAVIARIINSAWRTQSIYLIASTVNYTDQKTYPGNSTFWSNETDLRFVPWAYHNNKAQAPPGLQLFNEAIYGISATQVAEASARAWMIEGNEYNNTVALDRLQTAISSDGALNPFSDGASWEGMFTLPVCDMGDLLGDYEDTMYPCCCGTNCKDTKQFIQAANLNTSSALLGTCKKFLEHTGVDFNSIDYGIVKKNWFTSKSTAVQAMIIFGAVVGFLAIIGSLIFCCCVL